MGYDLHLTRADNWSDAASDPIDLETWLSVVSSFARAGDVSFREPTGDVVAHPVFLLPPGDPRVSPSLLLRGGEVEITGATEHDIPALLGLAHALGARLFGDDDEEYG